MFIRLKDYGRNHNKRKEYIHQKREIEWMWVGQKIISEVYNAKGCHVFPELWFPFDKNIYVL
jgi:hypothetical protein